MDTLALDRGAEMEDFNLPIVSICIVADRNKAPAGFTPITKAHDDGSDADLWREGFGLSGFFNRSVRYIAVSRQISTPASHEGSNGTSSFGSLLALEVVTDLAVISEKEAVPSNFVCLDFTVDSKERALKKKFLCARFTSRNDTLDAVTDIVVLAKSRRAPKGYTTAGEVDGMLICFRVATIPDSYASRLSHSHSAISSSEASRQLLLGGNPSTHPSLYPPLGAPGYSHSTNNLAGGQPGPHVEGAVSAFTIRQSAANQPKGIDGVPFQLSARFSSTSANDGRGQHPLPSVSEPRSLSEGLDINLRLERQIIA